MNQRGWKHFGTKSLPQNTYHSKERAITQKHVDRSWKARLLAGIFVSVGAMLTLLYHPFFSIQTVMIEGVESIPSATIKTVVERTLHGKQLSIIPRNNIFFLERSAIRAAVEEFLIPETITITPQWGKVLSIRITEYPIVVYWKEGSNKYSMNEKGFITEQIPNTYSIPKEGVIIIEDAARTVRIGSQILNSEQVVWLLRVTKLLKDQLNILPVAVIVSQTHSEIVQMRLERLDLTLTFNDTPEAQILRLKVLTDSKPALLTDTTRHTIDLRFGEKVYYH